MKHTTFFVARLMPLWIVFFSIWGIYEPRLFSSWSHATGPALGFVLFMIGLTLDRSRLSLLIKKPQTPLLGSLGKWIIAPLVSLGIGLIFFGTSKIFYGVLMAGIVPSGTSANLNAFIARGDLALSVTMSAVDTIVGPLFTPILAKWLLGSSVHIGDLFFLWKMLRIVFFPLMSGILIQHFFPRLSLKASAFSSILSALALYVVVLSIASGGSHALLSHAGMLPKLFLCVCLQILLQMGLGYYYARAMKWRDAECRSMLFEVGICNTALSTILANDAFGPLAGLASMANMVCNLTLGSLFAALLSMRPLRGAGQKPEFKAN